MLSPKGMDLANDYLVLVLERVYLWPNESSSLDLSQSCVQVYTKTFNIDSSVKLRGMAGLSR